MDKDEKNSCNCSGSRCKYNQKKKQLLKDRIKVNMITKNFVAFGFKVRMIINLNSHLPVEIIVRPKIKEVLI